MAELYPSTDGYFSVDYTIQSSQVVADMVDPALYIDFSDLISDFWSANPTKGLKILNAAADTEFPREVVSLTDNGSSGTGEGYFFYDGTVSSTSNTGCKIRANGTDSDYAIDAAKGAENVWTNYALVMHLNQASGTFLDSTANDNDSVAETNMTYAQSSLLGDGTSAADFERSSPSSVQIADSASLDLTDNFTLQAILKAESLETYRFIEKPYSSNASPFIYYSLGRDGTGLVAWTNISGLKKYDPGTEDLTAGVWSHIAFSFSNGAQEYFQDGASIGTFTQAGTVDTTNQPLYLGTYQNATGFEYDGLMDEVRIKNSTISANWHQSENNNFTDHANWAVIDNFVGASTATGLLQSALNQDPLLTRLLTSAFNT